jgi:Bacterial Ig domain
VINSIPGAQVDQPITISGTATDVGGVVGGVEVSTDGGETWNPADGRGQWSFDWTPTQAGPVTLRSRAADDSANLEQSGPGLTVNVAP